MKLSVTYDECPICRSTPLRPWRIKTWDNTPLQIVRCSACHYALVNPRPSTEDLGTYYHEAAGCESQYHTMEAVLEKAAEAEGSRDETIARILEHMHTSRAKRCLDVGCGFGFASKAAQDHGFTVDAIELGEFKRECAKKLTGLEVSDSLYEDYQDQARDVYDLIILSQILEHASDVIRWADKTYRLLKKGGVAWIGVPNFTSVFRYALGVNGAYVRTPSHINFFSEKNMRLLLERSGFKVLRIDHMAFIPRESLQNRLRFLGPKTAQVVATRLSSGLTEPFFRATSRLGLNRSLRLGIMLDVLAAKE